MIQIMIITLDVRGIAAKNTKVKQPNKGEILSFMQYLLLVKQLTAQAG